MGACCTSAQRHVHCNVLAQCAVATQCEYGIANLAHQWYECVRMHAVQSRAGSSYVMLATCTRQYSYQARKQLVLYAIPGSI